jgi:hypothetical protein
MTVLKPTPEAPLALLPQWGDTSRPAKPDQRCPRDVNFWRAA